MFQNFNTSKEKKFTSKRVKSLRALLKNDGLDGVIVPKVDRYQGEYISKIDERLTWISGFTGSAGTALILENTAVLFVDGRYSLQARNEVNQRIFVLENSSEVSIVAWLKSNIKCKLKIAFDPWLTTTKQVADFKKEASGIVNFLAKDNLIDKLWQKKPFEKSNQAFCLPNEISGETFPEKLDRVICILKSKNIKNYFFSKPDAICWLLNIRGYDVAHNPVVNCFGLLSENKKIIIFSENQEKFSNIIENSFYNSVRFEKFSSLKRLIQKSSGSIGYDQNYLPYKIYQYMRSAEKEVFLEADPANIFKSIKNDTEIQGMRSAHIQDGIAFIKFLYWFFNLDQAIELDEVTIIKKLESFRKGTGHLKEISFDTICGSGPNGAIIHYRATENTNRKIELNDTILIDSGGQYSTGTTDITRTICRGRCNSRTRRLHTLVLKGLIALSSQCWPKGLTGQDLDPLARQFLWNSLNDYEHGTGHGVGAYLCVHEGPIGIHQKNKTKLEPGMILSIEPGFYQKDKMGLRLENLVIVKKVERSVSKDFLCFENLTCVPFQKNMLDLSILNKKEKTWLNSYHKIIYEKISPNLTLAESKWLKKQCSPINT